MIYESLIETAPAPLRAWMEAHRSEVEAAALGAAPSLKAPKPLKYEQPGPAARILRASQGIGPVFVAEGGKVWAFMVSKRPETWLVMPYNIRVSGDEIRAMGGEWREAESVYKVPRGVRGYDWIVAIVDANDGRGPLPRAATLSKPVSNARPYLLVKVGKQFRYLTPKETQPLYFVWLTSNMSPTELEEGDGWTHSPFDPPEKSAPRAALSPAARKVVDDTVISIMDPRSGERVTELLEKLRNYRIQRTIEFWDAVRAMPPEDADLIWFDEERTVTNALERLERAGKVEAVGAGLYRKV